MAQEKDSFTLNIGVDTSSNIRREQSEKNKRKLPKKKGQSKAKRKITNDEDSESDYETYKKLKISNDKSKQTQYVSSLFGHNPEIPSLESKDVSPVCEEVFSNDTFKEFSNVHAFTIKTLEESFGVTKATVVQQLALPVLMSGKDALVRSQTGSGKTLAYAVPIVEALHRVRPKLTRTDGIKAVVVLPTRELALQTYQCFELLVKSFKWLVPGLVVGGGEKRKSEKARLRKGINILVGTPGRINDHVSHTQALKLDCVQWLVLDEADRLLDLGYEREITSLVKQLDEQSQERRQTVLLSATLTARVEQLAGLALTAPVRLDASQARDSELVIPQSLSQHYIVTPAKLRLVSLAAFIHWKCQVVREGKMLVFMATQDMVDYHTELLSTVLTDTAEFLRLHGSMTQHERTQVFQTFKAADSGVLLCTIWQEVTPWGDQLGVTPRPHPLPTSAACLLPAHSFIHVSHSLIHLQQFDLAPRRVTHGAASPTLPRLPPLSLCSSLRSLSSCTSLESLRGGAPFRLPLWDRASAEFCFARSRDLLTRCPPRLDSSVEVLESSEAEETVSASLDLHQKHSEPLRKCLSSDKNNSDYWKMRRPLQDFGRKYKNHDGLSNSCTLSNEGTVTKSQSTDSASTLDACPSITDLNESSTLKDCNGYEHSASLKGLSLSSLNECSNISGYTSWKKLEAEFRITDPVSEPNLKNGTECSAELKPLSRFLDKFPELDDSPGQSFRPLDKTSLGYSSRGGSDYPSLREVSHSPERLSKYTEKYPRENNQVVRLSFKQLERHLDSLDLNRRSSENISTFDEVSPIGRKEELRRTELFSGRKQFVPQTPVFRRKLSQPKMGESSRRSTKSSPNSPSITSPKVYFRPRTNSLSEEKVRPPPSRRQSYNYSAHYDSSSSDSEFDRPPSLCQVPLTSLRQTRC
ncbi:LOW QUALITY PROTEIN: uncharacterized protein LOC124361158 [Homalodisca vitripennis]|uniref:LOW QUALITY PROTEIN: uncharacterized protein LOC124361158 n=1 Tax=Homalodisca vitripennis TaxID=197043 RepID=UPI001EEAA839|nr:LOW QUALITY PROTEIN: uncharacterized protein LOC124361158 [Homalodisca vitripennis]